MILNSYIHEQLAAAHRRDLLEAADHARLVAQARRDRDTHEGLWLRSRAERARHRPAGQLAPCAPKPRPVTR